MCDVCVLCVCVYIVEKGYGLRLIDTITIFDFMRKYDILPNTRDQQTRTDTQRTHNYRIVIYIY